MTRELSSNRMALVAAAVTLIASGAAQAQGKPTIELQTDAQKQTVVLDARGQEQVLLVEPGRVVPGDTITYTITARNLHGDPADNVIITDAIPEHMTFLGLEGEAGVRVLFSVDGGVRFGAPETLEVSGEDGVLRRAVAADYTHVRWSFEQPIPPSAERAVRFSARVD